MGLTVSSVPIESEQLARIFQEYDVTMAGVFGSVARGESTYSSDVDMIVRLGKEKSLLALIRLERELSEALGRKVDLLTEAAISPYLRDQILGELIVIYAA
jgi:hypothetical protein